MITKEEFLLLYEKNLSGLCTPEEKRLLELYQDDIIMPDDNWDAGLGEKKRIYNKLKANLNYSINKDTFSKRAYNYAWLKIAAGLLIFFTAGILFWKQQPDKKLQQKPLTAAQNIIRPGGNKAYLTMANGTVITLNGLKNGKLPSQTGAEINKVKDGLLQYNGKNSRADQTAFNIINIPRGGQYQVVLSDGTRVWLNSESSLKYPVAFNGKERKVELTGEAYFEVVKNAAKPFRVAVNGITVQDLGTHFNIMAYNDEKAVKTTLLEGSVKLTNKSSAVILKPGEQGMLNNEQTAFNIKAVDVDDVVAWKNGFFAFNDEDIQTIMNRIARWYDVDVVFSKQFKRKSFGGTVSRFKDVSEVLNSLELTGSIHFKVEGRRITVMP